MIGRQSIIARVCVESVNQKTHKHTHTHTHTHRRFAPASAERRFGGASCGIVVAARRAEQ